MDGCAGQVKKGKPEDDWPECSLTSDAESPPRTQWLGYSGSSPSQRWKWSMTFTASSTQSEGASRCSASAIMHAPR